jgi:hypothetical protein
MIAMKKYLKRENREESIGKRSVKSKARKEVIKK